MVFGLPKMKKLWLKW